MEFILIPLYGKHGTGKFTKVDGDYDGEYFSQFRWYLSPLGYVVRTSYDKTTKGNHIYLHKEVQPSWGGLVTDHINRDKLDNRSINLRVVTVRQNALNRAKPTFRKYDGLNMDQVDSLQKIRRREYVKKYVNTPSNKRKKAVYDRSRYLLKKAVP